MTSLPSCNSGIKLTYRIEKKMLDFTQIQESSIENRQIKNLIERRMYTDKGCSKKVLLPIRGGAAQTLRYLCVCKAKTFTLVSIIRSKR